MLTALRISNLAVIDELEVALGPGLTVLTGETGAGKSIVIDALGLLLGGRADPEAIRAGADEAVIEGCLRRTAPLGARLEQLGLPDLGEEISIRRVVGRSGRGKAFVNGSLVTLGVLGRLLHGVVDIASQHEHMALMDPATQLAMLDWHGQLDAALARYHEVWSELQSLRAEMDSLGGDDAQASARAEFVRFQLEELERVAPRAGEEPALELERRKLGAVEKLRRGCAEAEALLTSSEGAALELGHRAVAQLHEATRLDPQIEPVLNAAKLAVDELEGTARALARYAASLDDDPERLAQVDERLDLLRRLARKHGRPVDGLATLQSDLSAELSRLAGRQESLAGLTRRSDELQRVARERAEALRAGRTRAAARLVREVSEALRSLAMPQAVFEVRVETLAQLTATGADRVELLLSANVGEPPRPLGKVASGGEASRVLLALKRALAQGDASGTSIFDEADAGVSGAVAEVVGRLIKDVASFRQVLCITHLSQVAAFADEHLVIRKDLRGGRTRSHLTQLVGEQERTAELARMISGVELTAEALGAARALLRAASKEQGPVSSGVLPTRARRRAPISQVAAEALPPR